MVLERLRRCGVTRVQGPPVIGFLPHTARRAQDAIVILAPAARDVLISLNCVNISSGLLAELFGKTA